MATLTLTDTDKAILLGAFRTLVAAKALRPQEGECHYQGFGNRDDMLAAQWAATNAVKPQAWQWLDGAASESMRHKITSRAYKSLESAGLIVRVDANGGGKTTHIKLLPAGLAMAKELFGESDPTDSLPPAPVIPWRIAPCVQFFSHSPWPRLSSPTVARRCSHQRRRPPCKVEAR